MTSGDVKLFIDCSRTKLLLPSQYNIISQDSWTPYHDSEIVQRLSGGALVLRHLGDFEQFYLILRIPG